MDNDVTDRLAEAKELAVIILRIVAHG
jgi:hypothetical protein